MFSQTMVAAIDAARTLTQLDHLSTDIWKAWGAGQIGDEAQLLAMQLEARRKAVRGDLKPVGIPPGRPSIFPPRRPQRALCGLWRSPGAGTSRRRGCAVIGFRSAAPAKGADQGVLPSPEPKPSSTPSYSMKGAWRAGVHPTGGKCPTE